MDGNLTAEQQAKLDADAVYREPIGTDEILLVGDLVFGIPVLKSYYDNHAAVISGGVSTDVWERIRNGFRTPPNKTCSAFMQWTRTGIDECLHTLKEVQRLRELVREAESAVIDG